MVLWKPYGFESWKILGKRSNSDTINLNGTELANSGYEELLGILTDRDLSLASI